MAEQQLIWDQCTAGQRQDDRCDAGRRYRHLVRCRAVPGCILPTANAPGQRVFSRCVSVIFPWEPLNRSSAAEERSFFARASASKAGNTISIPLLLMP